MLFTGQYEHSIDAKGRLAIPAEVRAQWDPRVDGASWYAVPWVGGIVRLYTEAEFKELANNRRRTLTPSQKEAELQAILFGSAQRIEPDSAHRIRLPNRILEAAKLSTEVVLVGAGDRLEVHDRETWKAGEADRLEKLTELLASVEGEQSSG